MNLTRIYLSLATLLEIVEFPRDDELKRCKETLEATKKFVAVNTLFFCSGERQ